MSWCKTFGCIWSCLDWLSDFCPVILGIFLLIGIIVFIIEFVVSESDQRERESDQRERQKEQRERCKAFERVKDEGMEFFRGLFHVMVQLVIGKEYFKIQDLWYLWWWQKSLQGVDFGNTLEQWIVNCGVDSGDLELLKGNFYKAINTSCLQEPSDKVASQIGQLVDWQRTTNLPFDVCEFLWKVTQLKSGMDKHSYEIWRDGCRYVTAVQYAIVSVMAMIVRISSPTSIMTKRMIDHLLGSDWFLKDIKPFPTDVFKAMMCEIYNKGIQEESALNINLIVRNDDRASREARIAFYHDLWEMACMNGEPTFRQKWLLREICAPMGVSVALSAQNYLRICGRFAMFSLAARMAKIDGSASPLKVEVASRLFDLLEIPEGAREPFKAVFNQTVHSHEGQEKTFEEANSIAQAKESFDEDTRGKLYALLWDIACADGVLTLNEKTTLQQLCGKLSIPNKLFDENYASHKYLVTEEASQESGQSWQQSSRSRREDGRRTSDAPRDDTLMKAYATLGCASNATERELREAYHKSAKLYHEDILRSSGASEDTIAFARQKMRLLNEAWERICKARGI